MTASQQPGNPRRSGRGLSRATPAALAAMFLLALAFAGMAIASGSGGATVQASPNAKLGETVLVSGQGRTLYALSPETAAHLLCRSAECLRAWPPLTVPSRSTRLKAGSGVHGHLAVIRRGDGVLQVTLRGMPLYRFAGDSARGQVNGQGIQSFGGTWHAVTAAAGEAPSSTDTPTRTSSAPSTSAPAAPSTTPAYTPPASTPTTTTTSTAPSSGSGW